MAEAGQRQLLGATRRRRGASAASSTSTDAARLGEPDRGREPVGPAPMTTASASRAPIRSRELVQHAEPLDVALAPEGVLGLAARRAA